MTEQLELVLHTYDLELTIDEQTQNKFKIQFVITLIVIRVGW